MQIKTNKKYKQEIKGKDRLNLVQQITFCLPTAQLHSLEKPIYRKEQLLANFYRKDQLLAQINNI